MGWTIRSSNSGRGNRFFCSPKCLDWFWGPHSMGTDSKGTEGQRLTTYLCPLLKLRMSMAVSLFTHMPFRDDFTFN
jgi:hypothetical protein